MENCQDKWFFFVAGELPGALIETVYPRSRWVFVPMWKFLIKQWSFDWLSLHAKQRDEGNHNIDKERKKKGEKNNNYNNNNRNFRYERAKYSHLKRHNRGKEVDNNFPFTNKTLEP